MEKKKQNLELERRVLRTLFQAQGAATYVRHKHKGQTHLSSAFLHVKKRKKNIENQSSGMQMRVLHVSDP